MIVTPNQNDYEDEDRKYFLVLNKIRKHKLLKSALVLIKHILQKVESIDDLHNEMDEVNAQIESNYEIEDTFCEWCCLVPKKSIIDLILFFHNLKNIDEFTR